VSVYLLARERAFAMHANLGLLYRRFTQRPKSGGGRVFVQYSGETFCSYV